MLQSASQPRLVLPMLVSASEMAVARRRATLPRPCSWSSLSLEAHSGIDWPAQAVGLAMSQVSSSGTTTCITAWDPLRLMLPNAGAASQLASALSPMTRSPLNGTVLLHRNSGEAPVEDLVRPPNAATGTSMATRTSIGKPTQREISNMDSIGEIFAETARRRQDHKEVSGRLVHKVYFVLLTG